MEGRRRPQVCRLECRRNDFYARAGATVLLHGQCWPARTLQSKYSRLATELSLTLQGESALTDKRASPGRRLCSRHFAGRRLSQAPQQVGLGLASTRQAIGSNAPAMAGTVLGFRRNPRAESGETILRWRLELASLHHRSGPDEVQPAWKLRECLRLCSTQTDFPAT